MPIQYAEPLQRANKVELFQPPAQAQPAQVQPTQQEAHLLRERAKQLRANTAQGPGDGEMVSGHYVPTHFLERAGHLYGQYNAAKADRDARNAEASLEQQDKMQREELARVLRESGSQGINPLEALGSTELQSNPLAQDALTNAMLAQIGRAPAESYTTINDGKGNPLYQKSSTGKVSAHPMATQPYQSKPTDMVIPDGQGGYMVNPLLVDAKSQVASAGASSIHVGGTYEGAKNKEAGKIAAQVEAGTVIPEVKKQHKARNNVTNTITEAVNLYGELDSLGAAVNTDKQASENFGASIGASGVGQKIGRVLGTKEQSVRDQINQLRPTLMGQIRQATEMGAKGLDSEKELEFYLQAVGDPSRDLHANLAALKVLNDMYGLGGEIEADQAAVDKLKSEFSAPSDMAISPEAQAIIDKYKK